MEDERNRLVPQMSDSTELVDFNMIFILKLACSQQAAPASARIKDIHNPVNLVKTVLAIYNKIFIIVLRILNTLVPLLWQYLRYLYDKAIILSSIVLTFDRIGQQIRI